VIRSSVLACLFLAPAAALAQGWHGPYQPEKDAAPPAPIPSEHLQLGRAIALKIASPEFMATLKPGRLPADSHAVPGEQAVRQARDRIAFARRAPADAKVLVIPRAGEAPRVDGVAGDSEWRGALRLALEPRERKASVLLYVHGGQLYLAALAPGDRTADGFDQFRFWYHLNLSPFMDDERAMITGRGGARTLRGARLPRGDGRIGEIRDGLDPKSFGIHPDWGVSGKLRGVSTVTGFRQYEASVDLADAGLRPGTPFPAYFEIEGDSAMERGRYVARFIEGAIGSAKEPIWLRIAP
jgi:hypothetical protein